MSMNIAPTAKFPALTFTGNSLADVIKIINDKNVLALHTTKACRVFHAISFEKPDSAESLKDVRVVYLDCNSNEGLLGEGEWEWYIKNKVKDVHELGHDNVLRKAIIEQRAVPNKEYVSLDY